MAAICCLRRGQPHRPTLCARPPEYAGIERLGEEAKSRAVPEDELQPVGTPRAEHVEGAREGILAKRRLHQRGEPGGALAEINRIEGDHHAQARRNRDHRCPRSTPRIATSVSVRVATGTRTRRPDASISIATSRGATTSAITSANRGSAGRRSSVASLRHRCSRLGAIACPARDDAQRRARFTQLLEDRRLARDTPAPSCPAARAPVSHASVLRHRNRRHPAVAKAGNLG
jgi:hypothetical protein